MTTRFATGLPPVVAGFVARTLTTTPGLASAEVAAAPFWYTNFVFEFSSNLWARARPSRSVSVEPSLPVTQPAAPKCLCLWAGAWDLCAAATATAETDAIATTSAAISMVRLLSFESIRGTSCRDSGPQHGLPRDGAVAPVKNFLMRPLAVLRVLFRL